jgi:hypothetical protein
MPSTIQALVVLFVLLPGFLAAYILQALVARPKQTDLEKVIEALIFSFLIYLTSALIIGTKLPLSWHLQQDSSGNLTYTIQTAWNKLWVLILLPTLFGVISAFLIKRDSLHWLRRLHLTDRTTRSSIWNDVLQDITGVAQVELADGRSVMGWVTYYSDDPDEASIFLEKAAWVKTGTDELEPIAGPGILLTKQAGIKAVMFLDASETAEEENHGQQPLKKSPPAL